jgi:hypothetical protein
MKKFQTIVQEAKSPYVIYHDSYTSAIQEVEKYVFKKKMFLDNEEMFDKIGSGPRKPGAGKTNRFSLALYKNEKALEDKKALRKAVHFQIYGRGNTNDLGAQGYELNMYIS